MNIRQGERFKVVCVLATSVGLLLSGVSSAQAAAKSMANCQVVMIPKTTDNPFYAAIHFGADQAATELKGKKVQFAGTAQADSQVSYTGNRDWSVEA
jgi:ABC-type sugar transport system substrate-binding protein